MEAAQWLGLTRQTYYRKLKAHREINHDGSRTPWRSYRNIFDFDTTLLFLEKYVLSKGH